MTPRAYMIVGSLVGAGMVAAAFLAVSPALALVAFAGGAFFGKGYGLWEERSRRAIAANAPTAGWVS